MVNVRYTCDGVSAPVYWIVGRKTRRGLARVTDKTRTFFVLNLSLDVVDGIRGLHLQGNGLAGDCVRKSEGEEGGLEPGRASREPPFDGASVGLESARSERRRKNTKRSDAGNR